MADDCPLLKDKGIARNDTEGGREICRNCLLEKCIYDVELKGRSRKAYIKKQLEGINDKPRSLLAIKED